MKGPEEKLPAFLISRYPSRSFRYVQDVSITPWLDMGVGGTGATLYGCDDLTAWDTGGQIHITVKALGIEETVTSTLISRPLAPVDQRVIRHHRFLP
ncbi:MAG: hypothetical protein K6U80_17250 [Firmicutes bacterium]|nr:hypothetical protein [Bacillota bacterium]